MNRPASKSFEDLIVWRKAHYFVLSVYRFSSQFPKCEKYGLTSKLRRAAVSIPANIAEGFRRKTKPDKGRIMNMAQSSLEECRYYLRLANDLDYGNSGELRSLLEEISRMLDAYVSKLLSSDS